MADRRVVSRRIALAGSALLAVAAAGFLLGACGGGGGGSALATLSGRTSTLPGVSATEPVETTAPTEPTRTVPTLPVRTTTLPATTDESTTEIAVTTPETTIETDTGEITTTPPPPPPPPRITVIETQTTVVTPTVPTTATESTPTETAESSTPWGWIALVVALVAAIAIGILLWSRRRAGASSWSAQRADLTQRSLVALDDVLAGGSVVTGRIQALAAEARALEQHAPDDPARAASAELRGRLDELAGTLEADRALRLASPPPSPEQLSYSTALIREQVGLLQAVLRPPDAR